MKSILDGSECIQYVVDTINYRSSPGNPPKLLRLIIEENFELNSHITKDLKGGYFTLRTLKLIHRFTPFNVRT